MTIRAGLVPLAVLLLVPQLPDWRPVEVVGVSGRPMPASLCAFENSQLFRRGAAGQIDVNCASPAPVDLLHCDVAGYESRDVPVAELCRSQTVKLDLGRQVEVQSQVAGNFRIRWFRWVDTRDPEVHAERQALNVASFVMLAAPGTFVRFSIAGLSPVTTSAEELTAQPTWKLANPGPGGDLFARHQPGDVVPESVEVTGPLGVTMSIANGWFDRPGLPQGIYEMRRVYAGGLRTPAVRAEVALGQPTDAFLPLEAVGGARILADPSACENGDLIEVLDGKNQPIGSQSSTCQWRIAGLTPGGYTVKITPAGDMPIVVRPFAIESQRWTDVIVQAPPVVVRGIVRLLGEPAAGLELTFTRLFDTPERASAIVKRNGHYAIGLEHAGAYDTALKTPVNTRFDRTDLQAGINNYDIDIKGGRIRIQFASGTPRGNARVWIDTPSGKTTVHTISTEGVTDFPVYEQGAFGIGGTALDGANRGVPVDRYQTVRIDEGTPRAAVEFGFAPFNEDLVFVDANGRPSPGAFLKLPYDSRSADGGAGAASPTSQIRTAPYGLPLGTPLRIFRLGNASFTCIELTSAGSARVTLPDNLARVELRFDRAGDDLAGLVSGISGATCAVPLSAFQNTRQQRENYESVFVTLPVGALVLERDGRRYAIRAPGGPYPIK